MFKNEQKVEKLCLILGGVAVLLLFVGLILQLIRLICYPASINKVIIIIPYACAMIIELISAFLKKTLNKEKDMISNLGLANLCLCNITICFFLT